jgi:hypothetical protein
MRILTGKNADRYCSTTQNRTEWYVYDMIAIPMTILGLRNLNSDRSIKNPNWVLSWKSDANLRRAIDLVFLFLKGWQAFRTSVPNDRKLRRLKTRLPTILLRFQAQMKNEKLFSIAEANLRHQGRVVRAMAEAVNEISKYKTEENPMLASKILHFFFPEFFPIWDTVWIKRKCLRRLAKDGGYPVIGRDLSDLNRAGQEYARYVRLMLNDIACHPAGQRIRGTFLHNADIDTKVIDWHYHDLTPTFFEMCLLGKCC